jgi:hypothetical protein
MFCVALNFNPRKPRDVIDAWRKLKGFADMTSSPELATLQIGDFARHRDATFELRISDGVVPLKLVGVDPAGASGRAGGAFSLLFAAPKGSWLPQAIYPVSHPSLGNMEIFLVPIGALADGNGYQAIFA